MGSNCLSKVVRLRYNVDNNDPSSGIKISSGHDGKATDQPSLGRLGRQGVKLL